MKPGHICLSSDLAISYSPELIKSLLEKIEPETQPIMTKIFYSQLNYDKANDFYAFGILWYHICNGKSPYNHKQVSKTIDKMNKDLIDVGDPKSEVNLPIECIIRMKFDDSHWGGLKFRYWNKDGVDIKNSKILSTAEEIYKKV